MIKKGSQGEAVKRVQALIGIPAPARSGAFCARTEALLKAWQRKKGLGADGVVGPLTWVALVHEALRTNKVAELWPRREVIKVELPSSPTLDKLVDLKTTYGHLRTSGLVAQRLKGVFAELDGSGVVLTTSGGMRSLRKEVTKTRSSTSMHYLGRAIDLGVYTGGVDPGVDPLIVASDPDLATSRRFRVYARATNIDHPLVGVSRPVVVSLNHGALVRLSPTPLVDITALMERHGFKSIPARSWAWAAPCARDSLKGLEWWHWQHEAGLELGLTTFGDELLSVHGYERASSTGPWARAGEFFGEGFR